MRYNVDRLLRGLKHPNLIGRELNRLYHTRLHQWDYNHDGIDIFDEDWDNLLLLDACRLDIFRQIVDISGEYEDRVSRGASTIEFLRGNLRGRDLTDTVYVTSNPQLEWHRDEIDVTFHEIINLWDDNWNNEHNTVLPETVTEHAIKAQEEFPDKRLIVHYMQPHYPFIDAQEVDDRFADIELPDKFWHRVMAGNVDIQDDTAHALYEHNLKQALPPIESLIENLEGKTVLTADHGNMIGHRSAPIPVKEWGHPIGIYIPGLVNVPWLIIDKGERKDTRSESSQQTTAATDDDAVKERLRRLGYRK